MKKFLHFTNTSSITKRFSNTSLQLNTCSPYLLSISGGQDSIVMFFVFLHLIHFKERLFLNSLTTKQIDWIKFIYCQHFWQPKNFCLAVFLFQISFNFEIPLIVIFPTISFLNENNSRNWRKKNFYRISQIEKSQNLLNGQTLTDNLENFFSNIFRGTSKIFLNQNSILFYRKTQNKYFSPNISTYCNDCGLKLINKIILRKKLNFFCFTKTKELIFLKRFIEPKHYKKELKPTNYWYYNFNFNSTKSLILKKHSKSFCFYIKSSNKTYFLTKPIKDYQRFSISALRQFYFLPNFVDITNFSSAFLRNKIRHIFIPFIKSLLNKKIEKLINQFLDSISIQQKELDYHQKQLLILCNYLKLDLKTNRNFKFLKTSLNSTLYKKLVKKLINEYLNSDINFQQLIKLKKNI